MKRKLPKVPEIKLVYRPKVKASKRRKIRQAEDVYQIFMQHWNKVKMPDGRKLLKLAYIYGANASGKTTILKAIEFLRQILLEPTDNKSVKLRFDPFLFRSNPFEVPSYMELSFYFEGIRHVYTINFNKQSVISERLVFYQTARPAELFARNTDLEKRLSKIQFGSRIKIAAREKDLLESNTLHNNTVFGAYARTNVDIPELEALNLWFSAFLLGMITSSHDLTEITASMIDKNPKINIWVDEFLNKANHQIAGVNVPERSDNIGMAAEDAARYEIKTRITPVQGNFSVITNIHHKSDATANLIQAKHYGPSNERRIDFVHKISDGHTFSLSIQKESSGTKRHFGLGGPLYALIHGTHLLCIDELETSLHSDLMKHFLQVFLMNSANSQMLLTTHNLSLMAEPDFIRRDALWLSEKEKDGSVSLFSVSDFDTSTLRKDASLSNAYKSGKLGAKPNLGSPYISQQSDMGRQGKDKPTRKTVALVGDGQTERIYFGNVRDAGRPANLKTYYFRKRRPTNFLSGISNNKE